MALGFAGALDPSGGSGNGGGGGGDGAAGDENALASIGSTTLSQKAVMTMVDTTLDRFRVKYDKAVRQLRATVQR